MKIILGSASARRQTILKAMGYEFDIMPADINEKAIRDSDPEKLTMTLANAKADALTPRIKESAILITSDLVVVFQGKIIEKPESKEEAYRVLNAYNQEPISTVCSVVVTNTKTGKRFFGTDVSIVYFNPIPPENIKEFVESGKVFEHAGSFAAENPLFALFVKKIDGTLESIMGMPVDLTKRLIEEAFA
jgi:septum formation protein